MCSEIHLFSSFLRRMSAADTDHHQILPNHKKKEIIDSKSPQSDEEREKVEGKIHDEAAADHFTGIPEQLLIKNEDGAGEATGESSEDEDGFRTPTSPDHRIPVITLCPPAPKKLGPPPSRLKRKAASPPLATPSIQLDEVEVESIFSPTIDEQRRRIKKARTTESSDDE